jgi:hypothetical protein
MNKKKNYKIAVDEWAKNYYLLKRTALPFIHSSSILSINLNSIGRVKYGKAVTV